MEKVINWLPIPDYENYYEICNDGSVRCNKREINTDKGIRNLELGYSSLKLLTKLSNKKNEENENILYS